MDNNHEVFDDYTMGFDFNNIMIKRKYEHSYRVMKESASLAEAIGFDEEGVELAKIIGLFHDLGRFEQVKKYNTFNDNESIDHAETSCDVLFKEGLIDKLQIPENSEEVISKAIYNHNKHSYDDSTYDEAEKIFCKIIRDADKIDIFYIFASGQLELEYDDEFISEKVKKDFFSEKLINSEDVKTKNDKIVQFLAFVFDLNYDYSKKKIIKEKYIETIYKLLDKEIFKEYYDKIINYLKEEK